jgi:hypothetical protein
VGRSPVVRQQGVDVILPGGTEAGEDVLEPGAEVDPVVLAGSHEAGDSGWAGGADSSTSEKIGTPGAGAASEASPSITARRRRQYTAW